MKNAYMNLQTIYNKIPILLHNHLWYEFKSIMNQTLENKADFTIYKLISLTSTEFPRNGDKPDNRT